MPSVCHETMIDDWSAMGLVLLIGVGVVSALATCELRRRTVLGNRMDRSFETLKARPRQRGSMDHGVTGRAPVRGTAPIKALRFDQVPVADNQEQPAEVMPNSGGHVPLHARRAS